jgi:hypothetical protein
VEGLPVCNGQTTVYKCSGAPSITTPRVFASSKTSVAESSNAPVYCLWPLAGDRMQSFLTMIHKKAEDLDNPLLVTIRLMKTERPGERLIDKPPLLQAQLVPTIKELKQQHVKLGDLFSNILRIIDRLAPEEVYRMYLQAGAVICELDALFYKLEGVVGQHV